MRLQRRRKVGIDAGWHWLLQLLLEASKACGLHSNTLEPWLLTRLAIHKWRLLTRLPVRERWLLLLLLLLDSELRLWLESCLLRHHPILELIWNH